MNYQWSSPGKLNLFLYVTGRRIDGYHYLQTLFQFIEYGDTIKIIVTNDGRIRLFGIMDNVIFRDNLIIRAAKLLQNYCWPDKKPVFGADIFIDKVLPVGSGLGGASSNAATVLLVLNQQWHCYLNKNDLMHLGLILGADVPVFLCGYSAFAEGIGNILTPIFVPRKWYLIIVPSVRISTSWGFQMYELEHHRYSPYRSMRELLSISFHNDFEEIIKKIFPEIKTCFKYLSQFASAQLTGTGSCIFSEFRTEYLAYQVQSYLPSWINSIVTRGINLSPLHKELLKHTIL
ncbi:4-(cytidine 5'-diphospho)-2-C-methyl-D-erythritol kinase [Blochmannia endosymbiont of Camponotus sp. C-046]|uniref:4-(cytidine 5'-diphospho)-2-C-methyl-D-erythritol kinase n=1 Tax=Blochmannia endosymbiont of Camponotus sp. C-046 TaxID=2945589 RepID=UPI0020247D4E|nr:4-(cytidine 5'-diphospho)-2-C-methyl-D-erythritol kinase [Blochmannia endosymbiont of Camponotus sp. C-046]URJ28938.1 4-(cytidine 5'-diphospho)-2-C-methyl-D-erythritol kinase [Blochmannia endosymbiont of Camponotus sp. C-046]